MGFATWRLDEMFAYPQVSSLGELGVWVIVARRPSAGVSQSVTTSAVTHCGFELLPRLKGVTDSVVHAVRKTRRQTLRQTFKQANFEDVPEFPPRNRPLKRYRNHKFVRSASSGWRFVGNKQAKILQEEHERKNFVRSLTRAHGQCNACVVRWWRISNLSLSPTHSPTH